MFKPETVHWLRREVQRGELSRAALGRGLCEQDGWRNRQGQLCAASARKALPALVAELGLQLPAAQPGPPRGRGPAAAVAAEPQTQFEGSLTALGAVRLSLARTPQQRQRCARLLQQDHPLAPGRAPGRRLVYLVESERGALGVLSCVAAPLRLGPRDQHLGWDERTCGAGIERIVCNDRFLLRRGVQVPNLASHVLGQAARRLADDWERLHGVRPVLLETCVDGSRPGTSYQAAGWQCVGRTQGRPPGALGAEVAPKAVWLLGLADDWRETLRQPPERSLGRFPALELGDEAHWSQRELLRSDLPDGRLRERLQGMGQAWERHPGAPLSAIFPQPSEHRAARRFLHNDKVTAADILQPHREALLERLRADASQTLLLVQNTTTLNYTNLRRSARGLGPLQDRASSSRGLFVHASVGFTEGGRPLGVSGLEQWARPEQDPGRTGEHEKESARWFRGFAQGAELGRLAPGKRVVVVGDRESDIFALFERQAAQAAEAGLLVRAHAGRQRKVQAQWCGETRLRELAAQPDFEEPVVRGREIVIDSQGGKRARPKRTATTELRIGQVQLQPPKEQPGAEPLAVWLVRVLETDPPAGEAELEWLLVSSEGGRTAEWAERIVGWYEARWSIEEYFRVLKSGAHIEERQLRDAAALGKCLVFDAITAWQVFSLQRYAREAPQTPAAAVLSADERAVVERVVVAERLRPPRERGQPFGPDIRTWVVLLARMAGWQPSKRHPLPGNEVLWRANVQLQMMVRFRQAARGP